MPTGQVDFARVGPLTGAATICIGYVLGLLWIAERTSYDIWGVFVIGPVLLVISIPVLNWATRNDPDPWLPGLLIAALLLKLVASLVRYYVAFDVYGGVADASGYSGRGALLAEQFRTLDFDAQIGMRVVGTGFIVILTGIIYAVAGPSILGGYLIYSWLGFWGLYFFYRAFVTGVPEGSRRRYALLLFFLPSLLFWPSSMGKDTWMLLCLGIASLGVARLLTHARAGLLLIALGGVGTTMVRPHVTLLLLVAVGLAFLLRRPRRQHRALGPLITAAQIGVLALGTMVVITRMGAFFGQDEFNVATASQVLDYANRQTSQGGSAYGTPVGGSPLSLPMSVVTVLFRPFPFEAHNFQTLMAALEASLLLVIFAWSWRRLVAMPRLLRTHPYVTFCLAYTLAFSYAFSHIGNFGILTRERVQVFPLALVLIALPLLPRAAAGRARREPPRVINRVLDSLPRR